MESILNFVVGETVNCSPSKSILGTYCKSAKDKKGDNILAGMPLAIAVCECT